MDEVSGDGTAEHEDDGSLSVEIRFHHDDEAELEAPPLVTFSAPFWGSFSTPSTHFTP